MEISSCNVDFTHSSVAVSAQTLSSAIVLRIVWRPSRAPSHGHWALRHYAGEAVSSAIVLRLAWRPVAAQLPVHWRSGGDSNAALPGLETEVPSGHPNQSGQSLEEQIAEHSEAGEGAGSRHPYRLGPRSFGVMKFSIVAQCVDVGAETQPCGSAQTLGPRG